MYWCRNISKIYVTKASHKTHRTALSRRRLTQSSWLSRVTRDWSLPVTRGLFIQQLLLITCHLARECRFKVPVFFPHLLCAQHGAALTECKAAEWTNDWIPSVICPPHTCVCVCASHLCICAYIGKKWKIVDRIHIKSYHVFILHKGDFYHLFYFRTM